MNDKFFDLKQEKQDRMINASLKIFSRGGYRHASTDEIVKEAGISKGLLFHYFPTKLGLYGFLFDYSARFMLLELSREVKRSETDYFALTKQMEQHFCTIRGFCARDKNGALYDRRADR